MSRIVCPSCGITWLADCECGADAPRSLIVELEAERDEAIAALKLGTMEMVLSDKAAAEAERDRLREYVGRLEATLAEFADAARCYYNAGERQSRYYDAENAVLSLGREIAGRRG